MDWTAIGLICTVGGFLVASLDGDDPLGGKA